MKEKTGGRQKGTPNKTTTQIREAFQQLVEENIEQLNDDIQGMKPASRVKFILEMAKFVLPQLKAVELSTDNGKPIVMLDLGIGVKPIED